MQRRGRLFTFFGATVATAVLLGLFGVVLLVVAALQQGPGIDLSFLPGSLGPTLEQVLQPDLLVPVFAAAAFLFMAALAARIGRNLLG